MPYPRALPLRSCDLLSVACLKPVLVHELGRLPIFGRLRIRELCNALILSRYSPNSWVHLITDRALVILGASGSYPFFRSLSAFHCASKFLITMFHKMLAVVMPRPVVSYYCTMSHAEMIRFWGFSPKSKGGVGIIAPGAAFGVGFSILPPGRQRLSSTCCIVYLSKSTKS